MKYRPHCSNVLPLDVVTSFVLYEIVEARDCPVLCCGTENVLDMFNCIFCARFCFVIFNVRKIDTERKEERYRRSQRVMLYTLLIEGKTETPQLAVDQIGKCAST